MTFGFLLCVFSTKCRCLAAIIISTSFPRSGASAGKPCKEMLPMQDARLIGTWKSDKARTAREIAARNDLTAASKRKLLTLFGRLRLRYTRNKCLEGRPAEAPYSLRGCGAEWWATAFHFGGDGDGAGAAFAYGTDGEEVVVGGDGFEGVFAGGGDEFIDGPARVGGFAPQDFKTSALRVVFGFKRNDGVGFYRSAQARFGWRSGGQGQFAERFGVVQRDISHKREIQEFFVVGILDAVFGARGLVFVVVVLERLGEAHCRQAGLIKRIVIATAAIAVLAEDQADGGAAVNFFDGARQFTRGGIGVVEIAVAGKEADAMRRTGGHVGADDVVIEHAADGVALLLDPLEHVRGAEQALLFAGDRGKEDGAAEAAVRLRGLAKQARAFNADRDAGGIVIGAGSLEIRIHDVFEAGHGIEVAGNDEDGFGELFVGAGKNGIDVFEVSGLVAGALGGHFKFVHGDLELSAGFFAESIEAFDEVVAGAAGATLGIVPGSQGETGAAFD